MCEKGMVAIGRCLKQIVIQVGTMDRSRGRLTRLTGLDWKFRHTPQLFLLLKGGRGREVPRVVPSWDASPSIFGDGVDLGWRECE